jgi:hypothetical protein
MMMMMMMENNNKTYKTKEKQSKWRRRECTKTKKG